MVGKNQIPYFRAEDLTVDLRANIFTYFALVNHLNNSFKCCDSSTGSLILNIISKYNMLLTFYCPKKTKIYRRFCPLRNRYVVMGAADIDSQICESVTVMHFRHI
jgi:hypothetical protein